MRTRVRALHACILDVCATYLVFENGWKVLGWVRNDPTMPIDALCAKLRSPLSIRSGLIRFHKYLSVFAKHRGIIRQMIKHTMGGCKYLTRHVNPSSRQLLVKCGLKERNTKSRVFEIL